LFGLIGANIKVPLTPAPGKLFEGEVTLEIEHLLGPSAYAAETYGAIVNTGRINKSIGTGDLHDELAGIAAIVAGATVEEAIEVYNEVQSRDAYGNFNDEIGLAAILAGYRNAEETYAGLARSYAPMQLEPLSDDLKHALGVAAMIADLPAQDAAEIYSTVGAGIDDADMAHVAGMAAVFGKVQADKAVTIFNGVLDSARHYKQEIGYAAVLSQMPAEDAVARFDELYSRSEQSAELALYAITTGSPAAEAQNLYDAVKAEAGHSAAIAALCARMPSAEEAIAIYTGTFDVGLPYELSHNIRPVAVNAIKSGNVPSGLRHSGFGLFDALPFLIGELPH
jgi:hypothetical protein